MEETRKMNFLNLLSEILIGVSFVPSVSSSRIISFCLASSYLVHAACWSSHLKVTSSVEEGGATFRSE